MIRWMFTHIDVSRSPYCAITNLASEPNATTPAYSGHPWASKVTPRRTVSAGAHSCPSQCMTDIQYSGFAFQQQCTEGDVLWQTANGLHVEVTCRDNHECLRIEVLAPGSIDLFGRQGRDLVFHLGGIGHGPADIAQVSEHTGQC